MKIYELFYIIGIILIIFSIALYMLSTTLIHRPEEDSVSNLLGKTIEFDSTLSVIEVYPDIQEMERHGKAIFLWIGIPLGITVFLTSLFIKRKKEGPDRFINDDIEGDEENSFPFF